MAIQSIKQVADFFAVTYATVNNWMALETFPEAARIKVTNKWQLDTKKVLDWYFKHKAVKGALGFHETSRFSSDNLNEALDYAAEKARLTKAQADHEESKVAERQKRLIPTDLVIKTVVSAVIASKAKMSGIPSKIKSRYPDVDAEIMVELEEQIREALDELGGETELPTGLVAYLDEYSESVDTTTEADD